MTAPDFTYVPGGPAEVVGSEEVRGITVEAWRLEGSDGDEIPADAYLAGAPHGVVVGGHGKDSNRKAQYLRGPGLQWATRGISLVSADAPLHGDRAGERPVPEVTMSDSDLVGRWVRDQRRLIDAVVERFPGLPLVYMGISMGAVMGCHLLAEDDRLAGGILVVGGSTVVSVPERFGLTDPVMDERLAATDPVRAAARIVPRPVLMLNADDDEIFSRRSALAMYDALGDPKEIAFLPGEHARWRHPRRWNHRMWDFVEQTCSGSLRT